MANEFQGMKTQNFKARVTLLFLFLALGLEALIAIYWFRVLEPQLMAKAEITARALAQPYVAALADILNLAGQVEEGSLAPDLERAVDRILVLTDPHSGSPFILRVEVVVDYGAVDAPEGSLDIDRGTVENKDFFDTEIPIYSQVSRELLGIVILHNSREVFHYFEKDVQTFFIVGAMIVFMLLSLAWRIVTGLLDRIRRTEEALQEKQAQVVHAGRLTAMGEMATGIAHEINQPLAIIRVAADGLNKYFADHVGSTDEARAAQKIVSQVKRAAAIIDNMRAFVRNGIEEAETIDIRDPVEKALSFFREQFRVHGIRLHVDLPNDPLMVRVNPNKFEQIIVNFLSNARYAVEEKSPPGDDKKIFVRLISDVSSDTAILEVEDNGTGMSQEVLERCMEPFYTTKQVGEGTGLGLSIANGIAREFQMEIEVRNVEGQGSLFRVYMKREKYGKG
jgi:signal transduction histidine kinase